MLLFLEMLNIPIFVSKSYFTFCFCFIPEHGFPGDKDNRIVAQSKWRFGEWRFRASRSSKRRSCVRRQNVAADETTRDSVEPFTIFRDVATFCRIRNVARSTEMDEATTTTSLVYCARRWNCCDTRRVSYTHFLSLFFTHFHSHSFFLTHLRTHSLSLTHTHTLSLSLSHTNVLTYIQTLNLSPFSTHTYSHTQHTI